MPYSNHLEQQIESQAQAINRDELLNRCMGAVDFAQSIVRQFLDNWDKDYRQLETSMAEAIVARDWTSLQKVAHRIKGTAATIAANGLAEQLHQLEVRASSGDGEYFEQMLKALDQEVSRVSAFAASQLVPSQ